MKFWRIVSWNAPIPTISVDRHRDVGKVTKLLPHVVNSMIGHEAIPNAKRSVESTILIERCHVVAFESEYWYSARELAHIFFTRGTLVKNIPADAKWESFEATEDLPEWNGPKEIEKILRRNSKGDLEVFELRTAK